MCASKISAPNSPTSTAVIENDNNFQYNGLRIQGPPFGLENIFDYEQGGHHPVHLGDCFSEGRYRIIHKLGSGGFANVWLCRDTKSLVTKYISLKILMAETSMDDCPELRMNRKLAELRLDSNQEAGMQNICLPLDQFQIDGPNGSHLCFVYPVLGPFVSSYTLNMFENPDKVLRNICLDVVQALGFLHGHEICHGGESPLRL
jgi:serine/threonine-protein kinase SRPK3